MEILGYDSVRVFYDIKSFDQLSFYCYLFAGSSSALIADTLVDGHDKEG
jgi:hypothetical protein